MVPDYNQSHRQPRALRKQTERKIRTGTQARQDDHGELPAVRKPRLRRKAGGRVPQHGGLLTLARAPIVHVHRGLLLLVDHGGRALARVARDFFDGRHGRSAVVCARSTD